MHFQIEQEIGWPTEQVVQAQRDRAQRLAAYLPHVNRVEEQSRTRRGQTLHTERTWWLSADHLPAPLRAITPSQVLGFRELIDWQPAQATFTITPLRYDDAIRVTGTLLFEELDADTLVTARGQIHLDPAKLPRLPAALSERGGDMLTDLLVAAARPNFQRLCNAIEALLDDEI